MATMSTELEKRKKEEYEMQLFGFTSRAVNATLDRIVEERIQKSCKKLIQVLEKNRSNEDDLSTLRSDGKNLVKLHLSHSKPHMNIIKKCVTKFISVPCNILLNEDKGQEIQYSEEEFRSMEKHFKELQSRAKKAKMLHAALSEELELTKEFERNEEAAEMLSTVIGNSTLHPDIDSNMTKCIENYGAFANTVKTSSSLANVYKRKLYNLHVKSLDLESSQPRL